MKEKKGGGGLHAPQELRNNNQSRSEDASFGFVSAGGVAVEAKWTREQVGVNHAPPLPTYSLTLQPIHLRPSALVFLAVGAALFPRLPGAVIVFFGGGVEGGVGCVCVCVRCSASAYQPALSLPPPVHTTQAYRSGF